TPSRTRPTTTSTACGSSNATASTSTSKDRRSAPGPPTRRSSADGRTTSALRAIPTLTAAGARGPHRPGRPPSAFLPGPPPPPPRRQGLSVRYAGRLLGAAAIGVVGAALLLELGLRLASLVVAGDPATRLSPGHDRTVILCAGDSHTWGQGKGYPAALAERLAARSPRYQVVNLGVPGSNTAQLRRRFPDWVHPFPPPGVVLLGGVNNRYD